MRVIDSSKLKKGDIILSTSSAKESELIRRVTKSDISHAMIYVADGSVVDSTGEGVQARNIQKMLYPDDCAIYAFRLKVALSESQLEKIIFYVRGEIGSPYDTVGAGNAIRQPVGSGGKNQFCSRLVARAYAKVGIKLAENPDYATPAQIKASELLCLVEGAVISLSDAEAELIKNLPDTTVKMRAATASLLEALSWASPKVRTLNDVVPVLLAEPGLDEKFCSAYDTSGYLEIWKVEIQRFPWRYDYEKMSLMRNFLGVDNLLEYCQVTMRQDRDGDYDHWKINAETTRALYAQTRLSTLGRLATLYDNLVRFQEVRLDVARRFFDNYPGH